MEVYTGEQLLAAQQDMAVSSLVDISAPGMHRKSDAHMKLLCHCRM